MDAIDGSSGEASINPAILMEIIRTQTEIIKLVPDMTSVMALVVERVQELTKAGGAIIELAEGDEMVYRAAAGMAEAQLGLRMAVLGSLSGRCVEQKELLICEDSETDERVNQIACRKVGLRAMVVAPLLYEGSSVGVLKAVSAQPHAFDAQQIMTLRVMADIIAAAIYHAGHHENNDLYYLATHDALTGLANRALFYDRLRQCLHLAQRQARQVGVLALDMEGLKPLNDAFGTSAGDAALKEVGSRINRISRRTDTVARLGRNGFGVILPGIRNHDNIQAHTSRMINEIRLPFQFEGHDLRLDASIGAAMYPNDGTEIETLVETAGRFMVQARHEQR